MRVPIQSIFSFTDYYKLNLDVEEVLAYWGYTHAAAQLSLPSSDRPLLWAADLETRLEDALPYVSLTNETARREFLIAPVVLDLARYLHIKVRVEFPLDAEEHLRGTLDYYLTAQRNLVIIEAKNADLQRGFTQLAAELVALDRWLETPLPVLYGAVSIGNVWQFGLLERERKHVTQDLNLFRVPADLKELLSVLVAILTTAVPETSAE